MPQGWMRFASLLVISTLLHLLLIGLLQRTVTSAAKPSVTTRRPPIQAKLIIRPAPHTKPPVEHQPKHEPKHETVQLDPVAPQPSDTAVTAEPEVINKPNLSAQTQRQISQLLKPRSPQKHASEIAEQESSTWQQLLPPSISTADLPEHLQNQAPPSKPRPRREESPEYPKDHPIASEIRHADGTSIVRMKSGDCYLVQDLSQLDSELTGKQWIPLGCKQHDSLAWQAFKERIAHHANH
ncbi:hypothetical protein IC617_18095 [Neiella sp. HB171785]|uniref:Uncharacterized protein n=1 Tax=Neiella litorisoli TaxID=2771431 RepID=A0A8J6QVG5_9GAMM|nr:hypothetical protein [Neiella litorisoli]MBD1391342.1 hypothetical protein [Neiella litorisoli]